MQQGLIGDWLTSMSLAISYHGPNLQLQYADYYSGLQQLKQAQPYDMDNYSVNNLLFLINRQISHIIKRMYKIGYSTKRIGHNTKKIEMIFHKAIKC